MTAACSTTCSPTGSGDDRFLTITNAANHEKDLAWFRASTRDFDVEVADAHERWAMLAVQGPEARAAVERVAEGELPARMRTAELSIVADVLACGTGYTGEDGVELLIPPTAPLRSGTRCWSRA